MGGEVKPRPERVANTWVRAARNGPQTLLLWQVGFTTLKNAKYR